MAQRRMSAFCNMLRRVMSNYSGALRKLYISGLLTSRSLRPVSDRACGLHDSLKPAGVEPWGLDPLI